jgi:hypothetical protein
MTVNAGPTRVRQPYGIRWWNEDATRVASALHSSATSIEAWSWHRRYLNLVCARYMTGRELPAVYGYSMSRRPAPLASMTAQWAAPALNIIATCSDVYSARIWKNRPFIMVSPQAGNFQARLRSQRLSRWNDGMFYELGLWDMKELAGTDSTTVGDGLVKVYRGMDGKITTERILSDELLVNEDEALYGKPRSLIQRVWVHREELLDRFGKDPKKRAAIERANGVWPGFYGANRGEEDILPLLEGWRLPRASGAPGRRVLSVGDILLDDTKWTRPRFPFARLIFRPLSLGYFGQGLAEQLLPLQAEINREMEAIRENHERMAWPRWMNPIGSQVPDQALDGRSGGVINHMPQLRPEPVTIDANRPEAYQYLEGLIVKALKRARISEQAAAGAKPAGLNSGAALMAWAQIDDAAHADVGQRDEDFVTDLFTLLRDEAEEVKPTVMVPGRNAQQIKWEDVRLDNDAYVARAFPMSRLPQLPAAKLQQISDWYADGIITKQDKMRLEQVPDTQGYAALATAPRDYIEATLDEIVETGRYQPPDPDMDLAAALQISQARYQLEKREKTPRDRLEKLLQFRAHVHELIEDLGGVGPMSVGLQPPPGAPAPPPPQAGPSQGPPQQLAA